MCFFKHNENEKPSSSSLLTRAEGILSVECYCDHEFCPQSSCLPSLRFCSLPYNEHKQMRAYEAHKDTSNSKPVLQTLVWTQLKKTSSLTSCFFCSFLSECSQLMSSPGNTLSDQIIAISQSGQNQRESEAHIQSLLSQSLSQSGSVQNSMSASQNMEKIDDLLVSLQESGSNLTRSY